MARDKSGQKCWSESDTGVGPLRWRKLRVELVYVHEFDALHSVQYKRVVSKLARTVRTSRIQRNVRNLGETCDQPLFEPAALSSIPKIHFYQEIYIYHLFKENIYSSDLAVLFVKNIRGRKYSEIIRNPIIQHMDRAYVITYLYIIYTYFLYSV